jgi:hypothetical protein
MWLQSETTTRSNTNSIITCGSFFGFRRNHPTRFQSVFDRQSKVTNDACNIDEGSHGCLSFSMNQSVDTVENTFNGSDFCQWLVLNSYLENEASAESYCKDLINQKQLMCINRLQNEGSINSATKWYAFSK